LPRSRPLGDGVGSVDSGSLTSTSVYRRPAGHRLCIGQ
jgi:hypothetical protein